MAVIDKVQWLPALACGTMFGNSTGGIDMAFTTLVQVLASFAAASSGTHSIEQLAPLN